MKISELDNEKELVHSLQKNSHVQEKERIGTGIGGLVICISREGSICQFG